MRLLPPRQLLTLALPLPFSLPPLMLLPLLLPLPLLPPLPLPCLRRMASVSTPILGV